MRLLLGLELGADDYLSRPLRPASFCRYSERHVSAQPTRYMFVSKRGFVTTTGRSFKNSPWVRRHWCIRSSANWEARKGYFDVGPNIDVVVDGRMKMLAVFREPSGGLHLPSGA
jgi:hypothetical protein